MGKAKVRLIIAFHFRVVRRPNSFSDTKTKAGAPWAARRYPSGSPPGQTQIMLHVTGCVATVVFPCLGEPHIVESGHSIPNSLGVLVAHSQKIIHPCRCAFASPPFFMGFIVLCADVMLAGHCFQMTSQSIRLFSQSGSNQAMRS